MTPTDDDLRGLLALHSKTTPDWKELRQRHVMGNGGKAYVATFNNPTDHNDEDPMLTSETNRGFAVDAHRLVPAMVEELFLLRRVVADMAEEGKDVLTVLRYRRALEAIYALRSEVSPGMAPLDAVWRMVKLADDTLLGLDIGGEGP